MGLLSGPLFVSELWFGAVLHAVFLGVLRVVKCRYEVFDFLSPDEAPSIVPGGLSAATYSGLLSVG